tara:strand:+ start:40 stop:756 length:717 start_codon:yes stop_codon:yes gene_type:complete
MKSNFVPGINSCLKIIKSNIEIKNIYINKIELFSNKRIKLIAEIKFIKEKIKILNRNNFDELLPGINSQGIIIEIKERSFSIAELIDYEYCKVLILDQIFDPQNLGACFRIAESFDFTLIIVPKKNSVNLTPTVHKIASGSTATVGFKTVSNISRTIDFFKKNKFWIYGFVPQSGQSLMNTKFEKKSVFVFGSEGKGLRNLTKDKCDFLINIEVNDKSESLNISSAFSIVAYKSFINL